MAFLSCALVTC